MLLLNPQSVKFGVSVWLDVTAVVVDRDTARPALEWSDLGPHVVFADAPEQRITVRVTRRLVRDTIASPRPGDSAELLVYAAPTAGDAMRRRIRIKCVVMRVEHDISAQRGAVQTITLIATSSDGAVDPIVIEDAGDGTF